MEVLIQTESYLSRRLDSLPDTEEADDPDEQQTQGEVPLHRTQVVDPGADGEHVISATKRKTVSSVLVFWSHRGQKINSLVPRVRNALSFSGEKFTVYGTDHRARHLSEARNLLPELGDGGDQGQVGGVGRQHEGPVHAAGVLDAAVGVPGVVALGPGKLRLETLAWKEAKVKALMKKTGIFQQHTWIHGESLKDSCSLDM